MDGWDLRFGACGIYRERLVKGRCVKPTAGGFSLLSLDKSGSYIHPSHTVFIPCSSADVITWNIIFSINEFIFFFLYLYIFSIIIIHIQKILMLIRADTYTYNHN